MTAKLNVRVVTPERPIHEGPATLVVIPAHDGELGILPRHARLLASLGAGPLRVVDEADTHAYFLEGGFVQVGDDRVTVLCERAVELEALDVGAAEAEAREARAQGRAEAGVLEQRLAAMKRAVESRRNPS